MGHDTSPAREISGLSATMQDPWDVVVVEGDVRALVSARGFGG